MAYRKQRCGFFEEAFYSHISVHSSYLNTRLKSFIHMQSNIPENSQNTSFTPTGNFYFPCMCLLSLHADQILHVFWFFQEHLQIFSILNYHVSNCQNP